MNTEPTNQEAFDKLLGWLDSDREKSGETYERIRQRLIRIFASHGCFEPERLTDIAIDRVMSRIDWLVEYYVGDPIKYFCGVARNVLKEDIRARAKLNVPPPPPPPNGDDHDDLEEREFECLDQCMDQLLGEHRRVVLAYYEGEGHQKIVNRKGLAEELGITLRALRLRAFHIRLELKECMEICMAQSPAF